MNYRERTKAHSRDYYRKGRPLQSKLRHGLLKDGVSKECWRIGVDHPVTIVAYTMRDAAEALGRTMLTFKKWVSEGILPTPIYEDTTYGYQHYSQGELEVVASVLREHEQEFQYVLSSHREVIHTLWQRLEGYRHEHY